MADYGFSGIKAVDNGSPPASPKRVYGKIAPDGHITEYPIDASQASYVVCASGRTRRSGTQCSIRSPIGTDLTHLTGRIVRVSLSGQAQEFAVPHDAQLYR